MSSIAGKNLAIEEKECLVALLAQLQKEKTERKGQTQNQFFRHEPPQNAAPYYITSEGLE